MVRYIGIVGSRSLPDSAAPYVSHVVSLLVSRGFGIASGGAMGADALALAALLQQGYGSHGVIFSAWSSSSSFPSSVRPQVSRLLASGGRVVWGSCFPGSSRQVVVSSLLARSRLLVASSSAIVAFLHGPSRGTLFTVRQAVARGIPVIVFLCGGGASLPADLASRCIVFNL